MAYVDNDYIRGVKAAAEWAHDNYNEPERDAIIEAVLSAALLEEYEADDNE